MIYVNALKHVTAKHASSIMATAYAVMYPRTVNGSSSYVTFGTWNIVVSSCWGSIITHVDVARMTKGENLISQIPSLGATCSRSRPSRSPTDVELPDGPTASVRCTRR